MKRYTLAGAWKAEPDTQGEWVLWRDVRELVSSAHSPCSVTATTPRCWTSLRCH